MVQGSVWVELWYVMWRVARVAVTAKRIAHRELERPERSTRQETPRSLCSGSWRTIVSWIQLANARWPFVNPLQQRIGRIPASPSNHVLAEFSSRLGTFKDTGRILPCPQHRVLSPSAKDYTPRLERATRSPGIVCLDMDLR